MKRYRFWGYVLIDLAIVILGVATVITSWETIIIILKIAPALVYLAGVLGSLGLIALLLGYFSR